MLDLSTPSKLYVGSIHPKLNNEVILSLASADAGDDGNTVVLTLCLHCVYARFQGRRSS